MSLGGKINELRTGNGLSQEVFAKKLGVSRQSVSKWEKGESAPDLEKLKAIADILGVGVDELLEHPSPSLRREQERGEERLQALEDRLRASFEEERTKQFFLLNGQKKIAVAFWYIAAGWSFLAIAVYLALFFLLEGETPWLTFAGSLVCCLMSAVFSVILERKLRAGKLKRSLLVTFLSLLAVCSALPFALDLSLFSAEGVSALLAWFSLPHILYVGAFAFFCIASGLAFAPLQLSPSPCFDEPAAQEDAKNLAAVIAGFAVGFLGTPVCWVVGFSLSTVFRARRPVRTNAAVRAQVLGMIFEVFAVIFAIAAVYVASKFS